MKKTNKKGFTIVELVIVIAVIAILAAVLVPNISRLVKKANQSADIQLVRNMNTALQIDGAGTKTYNTMHDALEAVKEAGYDVEKIAKSDADNVILWDSVNQCFALLVDGKNEPVYYPETNKKTVAQYQLWRVVDNKEAAEKSEYSVYWTGEETELNIKNVGFDAGMKTVNVNYSGNKGNDVTIRTNGGTLTVNAESDTVRHYGHCDLLDIQAVKTTSLHEYGTTNMVSVKSGRIVFETAESANTVAFVEASTAILAVAEKVEMPVVKRADGVSSFVLQTVSSTGSVATKSTVSIATDGTVTIATDGGNTPSNIKADVIKDSVGLAANKDSVKNENVPTIVLTLEDLKAFIDSDIVKCIIGQDIASEETIHVKKNKVIDLNGHTLTANCQTSRLFWLEGGCNSFAVDGTKAGSSMIIGDDHTVANDKKVWGFIDVRKEAENCVVTINGGRYSGSTCANDNNTYGCFFGLRAKDATLILNNLIADTDVCIVNGGFGADNNVFVNGGNYTITGINAYLTAAFNVVKSKAEFNEVELKATYGGCVQSGRDTTLNNCTVIVTGLREGDGQHQNCAASVQAGGNLTINGGSFSAPYALYVYNSGGTIIVNSGTFNGSVNGAKVDSQENAPGKLVINGGTFAGELVTDGKETSTIEDNRKV